MKKYSITKYTKNNINVDDWTSVCDIGKVYNGKVFSISDYKRVEDAYVFAILEIVEYLKIEEVKIKNVFKWKNLKNEIKGKKHIAQLYTDSILETYELTENKVTVNKNMLSDLIRLELREDIGGLLYVPYRLKIFIGYDYMMGVHSSTKLDNIFEKITNLGLNIYQFL